MWAMIGTLVAAIGTIGLYWQIKLTREAVQDTGKATLAMERQNELTTNAQRPWLAIEKARFRISGFKPHDTLSITVVVNLSVRNVGASPAINVADYIKAFIIPGNIVDPLEHIYAGNRAPRAFLGRNIAPNGVSEFEIATGLELTAEDSKGGVPVIYIPVSFIYNADGRDPPFETSQTYWIGKVAQGRSMRPFSVEELVAAPAFDKDRLGGLDAEYAIVGIGRMC
jgi:hypothetical protein